MSQRKRIDWLAWLRGREMGESRTDGLAGTILATLTVLWLAHTASSLGFPRDEGFYFRAATDYARWFEVLFRAPDQAMNPSLIDGAWGYNHEHPAFAKSLFSLSWLLLHKRWGLISEPSLAFRLPAMMLMGLAVKLVYSLGARIWSRSVGLMGGLLLLLMPRVFFHAHLACFDVPIMTMWLACVYTYYRAETSRAFRWIVACGVVFGLTLETKHNAWILPAVFLPHALWVHGRAMIISVRTGRVEVPASLLSMALIGPVVFVALWPWLWNDTLARVQEYINFHLNHAYYNIEYLHENVFQPPSPRSYAPVMILATVPSTTLVLAIAGLVRAGRGAWVRDQESSSRLRSPELLFVLAMCAPIAVFFLPKTPIFGGTKHWLTAYPFLALFAGVGFEWSRERLVEFVRSRVRFDHRSVSAAAFALVIVPPFAITAHSHPNGLSAYVPLVGGTAGGADLGLNRQFWGHTTQNVAGYLDEHAPRGARVFIHDTAWDSWARMIDEKRIRPDLIGVGSPTEADFALVQHELHMNEVDYGIWTAYETRSPVYVSTHDGVPIVSVYARAGVVK